MNPLRQKHKQVSLERNPLRQKHIQVSLERYYKEGPIKASGAQTRTLATQVPGNGTHCSISAI